MAIKKLKDIYSDYFQKSRVFLYPALGLKQGSITPINTYVTWEDRISEDDICLVCIFHLRDDSEFIQFEEKFLLGNPLFHDYKEVADNKAVYMFKFEDHINDWIYFMTGKYSLLSETLKKQIRNYYGVNTANYAFIHSYLYPKNYFHDYAKFLTVKETDIPAMTYLLTKVGELCNKPDFKREALKVTVKSLNYKDI